MEFTFSDIVGTTSLYFGLVSLLGSIFFFSLTQWLNDVLANKATWEKIKATDLLKKDTQSRLNCYFQAKKNYSFVTGLAWFLISLFMVLIEYKIIQIYYEAGVDIQNHLCKYIIRPSIYFISIYFLLSIVFLVIGFKKSHKIINEYSK
jgi:hypothetical protein